MASDLARHGADVMRSCPSHRFSFNCIAASWLSSCLFLCAADKKNNGDELFTNSAIRHLRIEISNEGMQTLRKYSFRSRNENERTNVPATVREGGFVWTNVALHLKGAYGSFQPVDRKPALTLNFDKWADGQKFHGLQKISLNNSLQDPSYVSEKICREIYSAAGVPAPRADYATVELNGRFLGLFVLTEGWNKQFLKRYFDNTKGNFYDLGGGHDVNKPLPAAFGENPTDHAMLKAVAAAANEPDHAKRLARLRATVDIDRFISLTVLDCLMWNWDGYAMNRNNYRMFHDLDSDRLVFFPHGVDQMFWKANGPMMTGRSGLVAKALLETAEGRRLYLERLGQIRASVFDVKAITNEITRVTARLQPALAKNGVAAVAQQQSAAMVLRQRVVARTRDIDEQLAGVKSLVRLKLDETMPLTNWVPRQQFGRVILDKTPDAPPAVHVKVSNETSFGAWTSTVWLEEGRYRVEGRIKTRGVHGGVRNEAAGAGFRVSSERKETRGASWGWFPYSSSQDRQLGGLIPAMTNTVEARLTGDTDWTAITHEFELRQPIADLQIQCVLQAATGEAWFDLSSLKIRRTSLTVSKSTGVRGE
jgi:spore coat protein H